MVWTKTEARKKGKHEENKERKTKEEENEEKVRKVVCIATFVKAEVNIGTSHKTRTIDSCSRQGRTI